MSNKNYFKDKSGAISVEFALIAPILSLIMMGLIDAGEALIRYRVITQMTESVANVSKGLSVAATSSAKADLNSSNIAIIKNGVELITSANSLNNVKVSVYMVSKSANTSATYTDKFVITGSGLTEGDYAKEVAAIIPGESILICESEYTQPIFFDFFQAPFNLKAKYSK